MDDNARTGELRRKLEKDPGSRLFAQLAEELRKEGKLDEAISVARKGLEKNPNYPSARLTLARALLDSGRPQEARPELEQIVKASPDNIMASRLLGDALEGVGELGDAMKQFEKTLLFSPGDKAVLEKIAQLKGKLALAPAAVPAVTTAESAPPVATTEPPSGTPAPSVTTAESAPPVATTEPPSGTPAPSVFAEAPAPPAQVPSVFGEEPPAAASLPSVFGEQPAPAAPVPSVFGEAAPAAAPAPPAAAPATVALDRDLASGTFSPGSLNAADLQKHFEETAAAEAMAPAAPPAPSELPAVEMPAEPPDVGAQTLPLSSVTLADLYLQQGLKAEASAVLSQVMKEEPDNAQAKSKLAEVSSDLADAGPGPAFAAAPVRAPRTRAETRDRAIASLRQFASAAEREAVSQRATEQGAFQ